MHALVHHRVKPFASLLVQSRNDNNIAGWWWERYLSSLIKYYECQHKGATQELKVLARFYSGLHDNVVGCAIAQ